jgi:acylphosphatase
MPSVRSPVSRGGPTPDEQPGRRPTDAGFSRLAVERECMQTDDSDGTDHTGDGDRVRAHVFVNGRVQGVFYRATTRDTARDHGVDGWVQNLADGRVEAVFEGPRDAVESMVEWCHTGSPRANVSDVAVEYGDPEGLDGFEIRR